MNPFSRNTLILIFILSSASVSAQTWKLFASGLQGGTYPKLAIAPNHDIYYGLVATSGTKGIIYKASAVGNTGTFTALPAITVPASIVNNIQTIVCNENNEPVVGVFRNNTSEPFLYKFDKNSNTWSASGIDSPPALGAYSVAKSPDGTLWVGAKWACVYRSTDGGASFTKIDECAITKAAYPCFYPSWTGNELDGAIYSVNVDRNGRVYVGTEGSGVLYSDDNGTSWHPADLFACKQSDNTQKDSASAMKPLSCTGNLGAIGFTKENNVIWNGADMWRLGWTEMLGYADMQNGTTAQAQGFPTYYISGGLQISKIVTTTNGQIFLHSNVNNQVQGTPGIYTSTNGKDWTVFNTGITGLNDGQSEGSLAVDGNRVFMATHDGKVWVYDASGTGIDEEVSVEGISVFPNPANDLLTISCVAETEVRLVDVSGKLVRNLQLNKGENEIITTELAQGLYYLVNEQMSKPVRLEIVR